MADLHGTTQSREAWPPLPFAAWQETRATLHMWTQIVGKVKLELTPFLNELWNVALHVTPRGLTTGLIPGGEHTFGVAFDFVDHNLYVRSDAGAIEGMPLIPRGGRLLRRVYGDTERLGHRRDHQCAAGRDPGSHSVRSGP